MIDPAVRDALISAAGPDGWTEDRAAIAPRLVEWRGRWQGRTPILLRPRSTDAVSAILRVCNAARLPVAVQGGNTGLVGGQVPQDEVLIALDRMARVIAVDTGNDTIMLEAGVTLKAAQDAAAAAGRLFPLSLAAEGSATIGGALATNAGGTNVLAYGNARELTLGLEAVLADGRVVSLLRGLRKDNTGYDLKQLFIGSEGTLGIITRAVMRLFPAPRGRATAIAALASPGDAVALLRHVQAAAPGTVTGFELMPRIGIEMALAHIPGLRDPLPAPYPWYALVETTSPHADDLAAGLAEALADAALPDAAVAANLAQGQAFWHLREALSEAQKHEGGSIKCDVSVPVSRISAFIAEAEAAVAAACPGVRPVIFGHVGDGNVHFNLSQPQAMAREAFLARWEGLSAIVHDAAVRHGGSISAEHGLGILKAEENARRRPAVDLHLMAAIKQAFDPNGILSPGRVLPRAGLSRPEAS